MQNHAALCTIVQGVQFELQTQTGSVRAVILRDVLESHFGASPSPSSWLRSFAAHEGDIRRLAREQHARRGGNVVAITWRAMQPDAGSAG